MNEIEFESAFLALTGHAPLKWQRRMYDLFVAEKPPSACNLPTGLGKTSVIPIWLVALANGGPQTSLPRRLAYVVNRRTVVDQATRTTLDVRARLLDPDAFPEHAATLRRLRSSLAALAAEPDQKTPLAVSTLRGQLADNGEWSKDPARPAVVVGTIDMIGSRLLFSGYRAGFKTRPLYAGLIGQDALLVHDEAHLSVPFQRLLDAVVADQGGGSRPFRTMALTATPPTAVEPPFGLDDKDEQDDVVKQRLDAVKKVKFHPIEDKKELAKKVAELALAYEGTEAAVVVFLRSVSDVNAVQKLLAKGAKAERLCVLTGTVRGYERDAMARADPVFARFLPPKEREGREVRPGTVYLLCTSAGEVGVDISADHMVCDLSTYESMAQRLGRVNRYGLRDANVDVVCEPTEADEKKQTDYDRARLRTSALLAKLPSVDDRRLASPRALGQLPLAERAAAFAPTPVVLHVGDVLFDAWALTTVRQELPGRPPVEEWLHGVEEGGMPDTYVAWRRELEEDRRFFPDRVVRDLLDEYPLKPQELLRDRMDRVFDELKALAGRHPYALVWVVRPDGEVAVMTLKDVTATNKQNKPVLNLAERTVVLPPRAGGLSAAGTLDGGEERREGQAYDVADEWGDGERRLRLRPEFAEGAEDESTAGMRLVREISLEDESDEEADEDGLDRIRYFVGPAFADEEGSRFANAEQRLKDHLAQTARIAGALVERLGVAGRFGAAVAEAVVLAARWHDVGKARAVWQRGIGNMEFPEKVLAKSGRRGQIRDLSGYRHEFGSLLEAEADAVIAKHPEKDLILHLIAAHHGRARPHFPADEAFDPSARGEACDAMARATPRRFAALQRRFGRWGLAWLESLVRAADAIASAAPKEVANEDA